MSVNPIPNQVGVALCRGKFFGAVTVTTKSAGSSIFVQKTGTTLMFKIKMYHILWVYIFGKKKTFQKAIFAKMWEFQCKGQFESSSFVLPRRGAQVPLYLNPISGGRR